MGAVASKGLDHLSHDSDEAFYRGKLQAMKFFFEYQLPKVYASADLLCSANRTTFDMQEDWF
jgi:butyryl-CoA dehydrogenase